MSDRPTVLFACIHNSGRSVAAQALAQHYAGDAVQVRSAGSERNAFAGDDLPDGELRNAAMRWALAGVLDHLVELTAVNLPSVNAYKRLFDYTFAPNRVSWALDNRTVAVRIPPGETDARRLEIRTASSENQRKNSAP